MRSELMFCICQRGEDMAHAALLHSHSSPAPHNPPDPLVTPSHRCLPQAARPPPGDASLAKGLGSSSEVPPLPAPLPLPSTRALHAG